MNIEQEHKDMVTTLAKSGDLILAGLTGNTAHILHMAIGIAGEAGEILDCITHPVDQENLLEEFGDLEFYMEGLRQGYGLSREDTIIIDAEPHRFEEGIFSHCQFLARSISIAASELLDQVKKQVIYNKDVDLNKIKQHLWELEYHMDGLRQGFCIDREKTLHHNVLKLLKGRKGAAPRYGDAGYSDDAANERADKS